MKSVGRIMVVDDEPSIRSTLGEYFCGMGYDVVEAEDGADALKKFVPGRFDCIISDMAMPNVDGLELLKRVKMQDPDVAFLIITGFPGIDSAISAMKEGACDYLTKPFHMEDIQLRVERALNGRQTETSLKKVKGTILTLIILIPVLISLGVIIGIFWKGI
jgi:DNA-binding NtrC family response regulator